MISSERRGESFQVLILVRPRPGWSCDRYNLETRPRLDIEYEAEGGREGGLVTHNDDNDVFSHQEVAPGQGLNICQNNPRCLDLLGAPPLLMFSCLPSHHPVFTGAGTS